MDSGTQAGKIRIELTDAQKEKLRQIVGREVDQLEFSVMELEERIAPAITRN